MIINSSSKRDLFRLKAIVSHLKDSINLIHKTKRKMLQYNIHVGKLLIEGAKTVQHIPLYLTA